MDNGLEYKVTLESYRKKTIDEKLDILFQVNLVNQQFCDGKTVEFDKRLIGIETARKLDRAKLAGIGIGSGGGAAMLYTAFKNWLSGGG